MSEEISCFVGCEVCGEEMPDSKDSIEELDTRKKTACTCMALICMCGGSRGGITVGQDNESVTMHTTCLLKLMKFMAAQYRLSL